MKSRWRVQMKQPANFAGLQLLLKTLSYALQKLGKILGLLPLLTALI